MEPLNGDLADLKVQPMGMSKPLIGPVQFLQVFTARGRPAGEFLSWSSISR